MATISTPLAPPPQQFTNIATLLDGQYKESGVMLFLNGLALTEGKDYTRSGSRVTMTLPPYQGDALTARVFAIGKQLGGNSAERNIAPWSFRLAGDFDGVSLDYKIVTGPTIFGVCNSVNPVFTIGFPLSRMQVFRNGLLQTAGLDVVTGPNSIVFLSGAIPVAGDYLTVLGY